MTTLIFPPHFCGDGDKDSLSAKSHLIGEWEYFPGLVTTIRAILLSFIFFLKRPGLLQFFENI